MVDKTILKQEADWLIAHARDYARLKRKVVLEYLASRVAMMEIEQETLESAEEVIKNIPKKESRKVTKKKTEKANKDEHESSL